MTNLKQGLINHVALVLDASSSMTGHTTTVIKVVDGLVKWLAKRSTELDQETRVSIYTFSYANNIKCVIFDKDVLRLPSIKDLYSPYGNTALRDATLLSQNDLAETCQKYGDHAFLTFVVTDGQENASLNSTITLRDKLARLPENWTVACLVPDLRGKMDAETYGFPKGNIEVWDTTTRDGVEEVGEKIAVAAGTYMDNRATGTRGSRTLFSSVVAKSVTQADVDAVKLKPIDPADFMIIPVALSSSSKLEIKIPAKSKTKKNPDGIKHVEIQPFVEETGRTYVTGNAYYRLTKSEKYHYGKGVALVHRTTRKVYRGPECEKLIGLDASTTRIKPPTATDEYEVYVRSTSFNRQVELGCSILLFNK